MLELIKKKILKNNTLGGFADENNIRRATLSDFLNGKRDIRLSTFLLIIKPLEIVIKEKYGTEKS